MNYPSKLQRGILLRRYQRFLVDIATADGTLTVYCPNTGAMTGCADANFEAWYSDSGNNQRKYRHTLELTRNRAGHFIGIHSAQANKLVAEAIGNGRINLFETSASVSLQPEITVGSSRLDFLLTQGSKSLFLEVKSVTLGPQQPDQRDAQGAGPGYFPDTPSTRAVKHLVQLRQLVETGHRAALVYCVQHSGINSVTPAAEIDSNYAAAFKNAVDCGVECYAYRCNISPENIYIDREIPVFSPGAKKIN